MCRHPGLVVLLLLAAACGRGAAPQVQGSPAGAQALEQDAASCAEYYPAAGAVTAPPALPARLPAAVQATSPVSGWAAVAETAERSILPATMLVATSDGGVTWHDVRPPEIRGRALSFGGPHREADLVFEDPLRGWLGVPLAEEPAGAEGPGAGRTVVGVFRTEDGGLSWQGPVRIDTDLAAAQVRLAPAGEGLVDVVVSGDRSAVATRLFRVSTGGMVRAYPPADAPPVLPEWGNTEAASLGDLIVLVSHHQNRVYVSVDGGSTFAPLFGELVAVPDVRPECGLYRLPAGPLPSDLLYGSAPEFGRPVVAPWGIRLPVVLPQIADSQGQPLPAEVGFLYADLPASGELPRFGATLTDLVTPVDPGTPARMVFPSPDVAVVVGDPLVRAVRPDQGWRWEAQDAPDELAGTLAASTASATDWWAVGWGDPRVWATHDGGLTWAPLPTPPGG